MEIESLIIFIINEYFDLEYLNKNSRSHFPPYQNELSIGTIITIDVE